MSESTTSQTQVLQAAGKTRGIRLNEALTLFAASAMLNLLALAMPVAILLVYDRVLPSSSIPTLTVLLIGIVIVVACDMLLRFSRQAILAKVSARLDYSLREKTFSRLLRQSFPTAARIPFGVLSSTFNIANSKRQFTLLRAQLIADLPFLIGILAIVGLIGGWLVMMPVTLLMLFAIVISILAVLHTQASKSYFDSEDARQHFLSGVFDNLGHAKSLACEVALSDKFVNIQGAHSESLRRMKFLSASSVEIFTFVTQALIGSVIVVGALSVLSGNMTYGGLAACTLLTGRSIEPLKTCYQFLMQFQLHRLNKQREILKLKLGRATDAAPSAVKLPRWNAAPKLSLYQVSVCRVGEDQACLEDITVDIEPGTIVSIEGGRGDGKTTFSRALLGLCPIVGNITINGIRLEGSSAELIRSNTTYIGTSPQLPEGTVIDALTMGNQDNYADVRYLSHLIGLDQAVKRLPKGYATEIGSTNTALPTGFLQKIAIVRALALKKKFIILDDATFGLDANTEIRLSRLIKALSGKATVLIFSDRETLKAVSSRRFKLSEGHLQEIRTVEARAK
ncbi:ABC transporter transmembrane domain-containing protein [Thalassospira povalilytica]|uniref:ABC transporter transmembrane domain-containing protein n=1 Tax=Thalassospira povalilytica TaxID=732237 RepID=UPI003AA8B3E9